MVKHSSGRSYCPKKKNVVEHGPLQRLSLFMHMAPIINPFPQQQILDSSKLKEIAVDNFKFY